MPCTISFFKKKDCCNPDLKLSAFPLVAPTGYSPSREKVNIIDKFNDSNIPNKTFIFSVDDSVGQISLENYLYVSYFYYETIDDVEYVEGNNGATSFYPTEGSTNRYVIASCSNNTYKNRCRIARDENLIIPLLFTGSCTILDTASPTIIYHIYHNRINSLIQGIGPQSLTGNLYIPDGVTLIPTGSFVGQNLTGVLRFPDSVTTIKSYLFSEQHFYRIELGNNIKEKGNVFCWRYNPSNPDTITELYLDCDIWVFDIYFTIGYPKAAWKNVSIEIGDKTTCYHLDKYNNLYFTKEGDSHDKLMIGAFKNSDNKFEFEPYYNKIGGYAFYKVPLYNEFVIPDYIEEIGTHAFNDSLGSAENLLNYNLIIPKTVVLKEGCLSRSYYTGNLIIEEGISKENFNKGSQFSTNYFNSIYIPESLDFSSIGNIFGTSQNLKHVYMYHKNDNIITHSLVNSVNNPFFTTLYNVTLHIPKGQLSNYSNKNYLIAPSKTAYYKYYWGEIIEDIDD